MSHRRTCRRSRLLVLLAGTLSVLGCLSPDRARGSALSVNTLESEPSWAKLDRGDVVRVTVWGHSEASSEAQGQRIDERGRLNLPLIGEVDFGGRTCSEAEALVAGALQRFVRAPRVAVSVVEYAARDFYVVGSVASPGPYALDRPLTALQGLSYGGQILSGANRESIAVLRQQEGELATHVFSLTEPGSAGHLALRPNDVIFVGRSGSGRFAEEVLPYLRGAGLLTSSLVGVEFLTE